MHSVVFSRSISLITQVVHPVTKLCATHKIQIVATHLQHRFAQRKGGSTNTTRVHALLLPRKIKYWPDYHYLLHGRILVIVSLTEKMHKHLATIET